MHDLHGARGAGSIAAAATVLVVVAAAVFAAACLHQGRHCPTQQRHQPRQPVDVVPRDTVEVQGQEPDARSHGVDVVTQSSNDVRETVLHTPQRELVAPRDAADCCARVHCDSFRIGGRVQGTVPRKRRECHQPQAHTQLVVSE